MAKEKSRYFIFLLYPESLPEDWELKLESIGVQMAVSPLHDRDVSERTYEKMNDDERKIIDGGGVVYKKAHYHVIYVAKNPVTAESVRNKVRKVLGEKSIALVKIPVSIENYYQYLTHESKDAVAKKKQKYNKNDIKHINNFDIERYISFDAGDKKEMLDTVCQLIAEQGLANILELSRFVVAHGAEYGLSSMKVVNSVLASHTGLVRLYFDGVYQERKYGKKVDKETGEIF